MTTQTQILNALQAQLNTVVGLPVIAPDNAYFKPILGSPYVRDTLMPVEPMPGAVGINGYDQLRGLYQIDIFYPENVGNSNALAMADSILAVFNRGLPLTAVVGYDLQIERSWIQAPRNNMGWYHIPLMVRWYVYGG